MEEFALIMRHVDGNKVASPAQIKTWMDQTMQWLDSIRSQGKLTDLGRALSFDVAAVVGHDMEVTKGPFGISGETVGGYIIVKANSLVEAIEFAKGCPVLQGTGNTLEVRKIAR